MHFGPSSKVVVEYLVIFICLLNNLWGYRYSAKNIPRSGIDSPP